MRWCFVQRRRRPGMIPSSSLTHQSGVPVLWRAFLRPFRQLLDERIDMANVRLCALFILIAAWPSSVRAQGWWDFLEELSGPGPFYGGVTAVLKPVCFVERAPGRDDRV